MDYKIWVTYHQDEQVAQYGLRNDEHHTLFPSHKDVDGENINVLNPVYSEMVTMWYVWKNQLKSDYVGFEHYRRHLNIVRLPKESECQVYRVLDFKDKTVYKQYSLCHNHHDMDAVLSILDDKYGKDNEYSSYILRSSVLIANCTFVMKWEDFCSLCEFMFPILEEFGHRCGMDGLGTVESWNEKAIADFGDNKPIYQRRVVSFLAERLISAWIFKNMKWWNGIDVAIVHYNTPDLTEATIRSLNRFSPGCNITIFDNSDTYPFPFLNTFPNVTIIDNTKGQIIDFEKMLQKYPKRELGDRNKSNFGSAKHCKSVDILFKYLPNGFVLMDSDVLVWKDIAPLVDTSKAMVGMEHFKDGVSLIHPFICWINVPMLSKNKIHYFNGKKMWALTDKSPDNRYDTGCWVYEEIRNKKLPWTNVDIWAYIIHLGHGSWRGKNASAWLEKNAHLWK